MNREFNPMADIPETDGEVVLALSYGRDELTAKNPIGIYQCERGLGKSLIEAYEAALLAHVGKVKEMV